MDALFAKDKNVKIGKRKVDVLSIPGLRDFLTHCIKKKPHLADSMTIGYSKFNATKYAAVDDKNITKRRKK